MSVKKEDDLSSGHLGPSLPNCACTGCTRLDYSGDIRHRGVLQELQRVVGTASVYHDEFVIVRKKVPDDLEAMKRVPEIRPLI